MRDLEPRERRIVLFALGAALFLSLAWTTWLAHLGVERGALLRARLWFALLVFGVHYLGAVVVLLKRPFDPANQALFPFLTLLGVLNAGRILGVVTGGETLPDRIAFAGSAAIHFVAIAWILVTIGGFFPVTRLQRPGRAYLVGTLLAMGPLALYL
ncbi:MAG TPA: hypothetical protein PKA62_06220, partial [Thermoanaerobaculia bacterium]|nr:hypothetical protein [Thermoanaerobaculia bacterium]